MCKELTDFQRGKLGADETVLWCGRSRPALWSDGCLGFVVFGLIMLLIMGAIAVDVFVVHVHGERHLSAAFVFVPFFLIGLGFVMSPLYHWIVMRRTTWIVTDRRILRCRGSRAKIWNFCELRTEVEWSSRSNGCTDFLFAEHWVCSKHGGGHMVGEMIENIPREDAPAVRQALLRLFEMKRTAPTVTPEAAALVKSQMRFELDAEHRRARIVFVRRRRGRGAVEIAAVLALIGAIVFGMASGDDGLAPGIVLMVALPLTFALAPGLYNLFGRREIVLEKGAGRYLNGVWQLGVSRRFAYTAETAVRKGKTNYLVNGQSLPEVQMCQPGDAGCRRILAHTDEAVVEEFIRLLRLAVKATC